MRYPSRLLQSSACAILALAAVTPIAFAGKTPEPEPEPDFDSTFALNVGLGNAALTSARVTTRDVGDRLFRMRAGIPPWEEVSQAEAAPASTAKGGMAKGGMTRSVSHMACWEVYGSLFYYTEDQDSQTQILRPGVVGGPAGIALFQPETELDIFGGTVGIERHFNENWSAGFAVTGSNTDVDVSFAGSSDLDTIAVTPYLSFYKANAFGAADYWADVMYSHGFHEFDTQRLTPAGLASGSPDADTDQIEFTTGVNFHSGSVTHGPYGGVRWIDGSVEGYSETGLGGITVPEQDIESLAGILGYQLSFPIKTGSGTLVPQVRGAWEHEFEEDGNEFFGIALGERDEDAAVLGAGIGYYCNSGWNAVLDYEARLSSHVEGHYVSLKVGKEF
jgi:uncharacterized protein YhjY with autotransporter beta-barrel domain